MLWVWDGIRPHNSHIYNWNHKITVLEAWPFDPVMVLGSSGSSGSSGRFLGHRVGVVSAPPPRKAALRRQLVIKTWAQPAAPSACWFSMCACFCIQPFQPRDALFHKNMPGWCQPMGATQSQTMDLQNHEPQSIFSPYKASSFRYFVVVMKIWLTEHDSTIIKNLCKLGLVH